MTSRPFVFGVDLDATCADFYGGLRPIASEWLGVDVATLPTEVSWGLPEWGIDRAPGGYLDLHKFAVTQRDLFRSLCRCQARRQFSAGCRKMASESESLPTGSLPSISTRLLYSKRWIGLNIMTLPIGTFVS